MKVGNTEALHKENTITVSYNGSVGQAFYQTEPFWASDDINVLYPLFDMNEPIALYLCTALRKAGTKYAYNFKWAKDIMENDKIYLPVKENGAIDFHYMEARIRELEEARIRELETYLKVAGFEDCELNEEETIAVGELKNKNFKTYSIGELFYINTGRDVIIGQVQEGAIPLVSHQHDNNGISKMVQRLIGRILFEHDKTIALADRGVFYATTQAEDFHIGTRVKALSFKDGGKSEEIRLFFVAAINKLQVFFTDYLVNATDSLPNLQINLPVTSNGEIDYHFMETYIRAQEKLAIQRVKDWRTKEIDTTKNIVKADTEAGKAKSKMSYEEWQTENDVPMMVAEDIFISGSLEVRLHDAKLDDLLGGKLDLILMYAIAPVARKKTESAGKIALGIKENNLSAEAAKAYESVKYVMFHYWKNNDAKAFKLTAPTRLVAKDDIPDGYLLRQDKDACQYLLWEYDTDSPADIGEYDIMKVQRKGTDRYVPFVCKLEDVK